jgi:hypothetical protein
LGRFERSLLRRSCRRIDARQVAPKIQVALASKAAMAQSVNSLQNVMPVLTRTPAEARPKTAGAAATIRIGHSKCVAAGCSCERATHTDKIVGMTNSAAAAPAALLL